MNRAIQQEQWALSAQDDQEDEISLRDYVGIILQSWKLALSILMLAGLIGAYIAWTAPPVYQSNALIQVEPKPSAGMAAGLDPMAALFQEQSLGSAEIEILQSRSVLRRAVKELKLDIVAEPRHLGGWGAALARRRGGEGAPVNPPRTIISMLPESLRAYLPDLGRYAWGGERITVSRLSVAPALLGVPLVVVAGEAGNYRVYCDNDEAAYCDPTNTLLQGKVAEAARARTAAGRIQMFVAELEARPGTEFEVTKLPIQDAVQKLHENLTATETAEGTGILDVTLTAPSAIAVKARLNAIANSYLRQNVQRQSEEARRTLTFVNSQLPELRENVNITEAAMRDYQSERGTVDLSLEAQGVLNSIAKVERRISGLELRRAGLMRTYTEDHPLVESLDDRLVRLQEDRARIEEQMKELPDIESDYLKLARNARVANGLYLQLLNRAQELKVTEAGVTGYVRIVDYAFKPLLPAGPNRVRILLVAVILGGMMAAGLIFLKRALARALDTPDLIERKLGLPVYATIPHSKHQSALYRSKRSRSGSEPDVLARSASTDNAIESLRSLRTSLQFALIEAKNNVITITGPTPGLGKTFVAVNLAFLLADINKRVLLVDADLRRGHTHRYLGHDRAPGLADVIAGQCKASKAIHLVDNKGLYFMATGTIQPNPSELLVHDNFNRLIEQVSEDYDMIIFDTPPILNLTDGIIIAKQSGTTFLVVRGGESTIHDVEHSAKRLQQNDIKLNGVIFNDLKLSASKYGYGKYGYYNYQYKPAKA